MGLIVENILRNDESKTLEFKENLQSMRGILKAVIAFANTAGGTIVIGVQDKTKRVVGITNSLAEQERLASAINDSIAPLIVPDIETQTYRKKELVIINVPHMAGPFYLKSVGIEKGTYIRLGSTNRVADDETLQTLKNFARNVYFDELPVIQAKTADLDWAAIKKLFKNAGKTVTKNNAQSMGLITQYGTKEFPSNGGIILFGTNKLKFFPEAIIRCARFLGDDRGTIVDQATIEKHIPLALQEAIAFINRNTSMRSEIRKLAREDLPQYPPLAIREAITNAIVHADYSIKGIYLTIAIFDHRIEITNPGALPFGITLEKAMAGSSRIRNRVIAKVFYHLKWIEQWGRGLQRIVKECTQKGLEKPLFEEVGNQFRVTLFATKNKPEILEDWQKKLIDNLKRNEKITTKQAAGVWNVTSRTARSRLIKMIDSGLIRKTGTALKDPFGGYVLSNR